MKLHTRTALFALLISSALPIGEAAAQYYYRPYGPPAYYPPPPYRMAQDDIPLPPADIPGANRAPPAARAPYPYPPDARAPQPRSDDYTYGTAPHRPLPPGAVEPDDNLPPPAGPYGRPAYANPPPYQAPPGYPP